MTGATYNAPGALTGSVYGQNGSFTGILNTFSFNNRLQPVNLWSSSPTRTLMNLIYDFHVGNGDNGNVYSITNNRDANRSQAFRVCFFSLPSASAVVHTSVEMLHAKIELLWKASLR